MIYAYDLWAQMPVKDLYDSLMMAIAINAAKDMYDKGLDELKEFRKEYGNFISPFAKDMDAYGNMIGGIRNLINNAYDNGIDLFRSPEGRMLVLQAINKVDPAEVNKMRANAKTGFAYQDAMQKLIASGKYDPDMAEAFLKSQRLPSFKDFSTAEYGTWGLSSPVEATTLGDLTSKGFEHRTPHELTKEDATRVMGSSYDPRQKYVGWIDRDQISTAAGLIPGLRGDWRAEYFRNKAAQQLGLDPNSNDPSVQSSIDKLFAQNIADANRKWLVLPTGDYDKMFMAKYNADLLNRNNAASQQRAHRYKEQELQDKLKRDVLNGWTYRVRSDVGKKIKLIDSAAIGKTYKDYETLWTNLQSRVRGDDNFAAVSLLANNKDSEPIYPGSNKKGYRTSFGGQRDDLKLTAIDVENLMEAGVGKIRRSKIINNFNDYLRLNGISGYVTNSNTTASYNPYTGDYTVSGKIVVPMKDLDSFFDLLAGDKESRKNWLLNTIHATRYDDSGRSISANQLKWKNATYVEIPVTRILEGGLDNIIDATVANFSKRGTKTVNEYEQQELEY